jgi:hypothetical protein
MEITDCCTTDLLWNCSTYPQYLVTHTTLNTVRYNIAYEINFPGSCLRLLLPLSMLLNTFWNETIQDFFPKPVSCHHLGTEGSITKKHLLGNQQDVSVGILRNSVWQKDVLLWSFMSLSVLFIKLHLMIICTHIQNDKFGASVHHKMQELS